MYEASVTSVHSLSKVISILFAPSELESVSNVSPSVKVRYWNGVIVIAPAASPFVPLAPKFTVLQGIAELIHALIFLLQ